MKRRAGWFLAMVGVIAVIMAIGLFVRGPGQADAGWLVQFTGASTYALIYLLLLLAFIVVPVLAVACLLLVVMWRGIRWAFRRKPLARAGTPGLPDARRARTGR